MRDLFGYITKHRPQTIILDYKLKPFIPDYIPAVGDIDAFLKVRDDFLYSVKIKKMLAGIFLLSRSTDLIWLLTSLA